MKDEQHDGAFWYWVGALLLLVVAAAIRLRDRGATLFEDEVWAAVLLQRGGLRPHTYNIPPLFYGIGRLWMSLRGTADPVLREPAILFGVITSIIPLAAPRSLRVRFVWALLLAFSSPLLFYSTRLKQYTLEAAFATALIVLFLHAFDRGGAARWTAFFAAAAAGVASLHMAVFIVAAAGLLCIFTKETRRWPIVSGFALVAGVFVAAYFAYLAPGPATTKLHGDMTTLFTATGRWIDSPRSLIANTAFWTGHAMNLVPFWWIVVPVLAIVWVAAARNAATIVLCILPPAFAAAASIFHVYPYGEVRLMIFCFPALYLLIAESVAFASIRFPLVLLVVAPFVLSGVVRETYNAYMGVTDLRGMVAAVTRGHRAGEPIFTEHSYTPVLAYYCSVCRTDFHEVVADTAAAPGWYVQRTSHFDPGTNDILFRNREATLIHLK